ncbi:MAG: hypothetical protein AAB176_02635 [Pseudomonadota bacterium]|jgi:hypothetical protein
MSTTGVPVQSSFGFAAALNFQNRNSTLKKVAVLDSELQHKVHPICPHRPLVVLHRTETKCAALYGQGFATGLARPT